MLLPVSCTTWSSLTWLLSRLSSLCTCPQSDSWVWSALSRTKSLSSAQQKASNLRRWWLTSRGWWCRRKATWSTTRSLGPQSSKRTSFSLFPKKRLTSLSWTGKLSKSSAKLPILPKTTCKWTSYQCLSSIKLMFPSFLWGTSNFSF